jgi:hypothetical protein
MSDDENLEREGKNEWMNESKKTSRGRNYDKWTA